MLIGRLLSPVHVLGPGNRVCLWTQGCSRQCPGCVSPELQPFCGKNVDEDAVGVILEKVAQNRKCSGLTVSGGDPFAQSESLLKLLMRVREIFSDILVYTGFTLKEIRSGSAGNAGIACLDYIDVLIDGPYLEELNTPDCILRGSSNQIINYFNNELRESYEEYMKHGRMLESFVHGQNIIVAGIFNREESL